MGVANYIPNIDTMFCYKQAVVTKSDLDNLDDLRIGDVVVLTSEQVTCVYTGSGWDTLCDGSHDGSSTASEEVHDIKRENCTSCGASLKISTTSNKGICTCSFCGKENYVW